MFLDLLFDFESIGRFRNFRWTLYSRAELAVTRHSATGQAENGQRVRGATTQLRDVQSEI